jgi:hypothetical protein
VLRTRRAGWKFGWARFAKGLLLCTAAAWAPGQRNGHEKHPGMTVPGHGNGYSPPARGHQMPELDAGSFGAALALVAGGTMILRGRRHRKP